jgi:hypothetical protein
MSSHIVILERSEGSQGGVVNLLLPQSIFVKVSLLLAKHKVIVKQILLSSSNILSVINRL